MLARKSVQTLLCVSYFAVLLLLAAYGLHRSHLVYLCWRHRRVLKLEQPEAACGDDLPYVTVQLPLFNEATVAHRLLDAVAAIDYPADRLEIQVLDDSTDETRSLAEAHVERLRREGKNFVYLHRTNRTGYKAGALEAGLRHCRGELVAIFDADFIPQPDFLRACVGHFGDPDVAMVQTRWGHLNRDQSILTKVQALMLDGHHMVENRARFAAGCLFNFSGTGGIWRKAAIEDAGGWQHDTLTEDLDLSYRAQLAGWKFVYRDDVVSPAELPEEVCAFRSQQFRWAKGTVQTSRKLLARVLDERGLSLTQRVEAFFHLTPHFVYPLTVLLSVLLLPALVLMPATDVRTMLIVDLPLCIGSTGSLAAFYMLAESAQGRSRRHALLHLPALMAMGVGLAPHLARAVKEGLESMAGEFVRTPKRGELAVAGASKTRYRAHAALPMVEIGLALISVASVVASLETGHWFATPFAALFTVGYSYVAFFVTTEQLRGAQRIRLFGSARKTAPLLPPEGSSEELAA
jgi:cellulose synthase/poly-beta-1,6-N-acetylglucosamine synthase-like glycosyltransferase